MSIETKAKSNLSTCDNTIRWFSSFSEFSDWILMINRPVHNTANSKDATYWSKIMFDYINHAIIHDHGINNAPRTLSCTTTEFYVHILSYPLVNQLLLLCSQAQRTTCIAIHSKNWEKCQKQETHAQINRRGIESIESVGDVKLRLQKTFICYRNIDSYK